MMSLSSAGSSQCCSNLICDDVGCELRLYQFSACIRKLYRRSQLAGIYSPMSVRAFVAFVEVSYQGSEIASLNARTDYCLGPGVIRIIDSISPRSEEHTSELQSHSDLVC